jgi:hypothetical protein
MELFEMSEELTEKQQIIQITDYYAHEILAPQWWEKVLFSDVCQILGGKLLRS